MAMPPFPKVPDREAAGQIHFRDQWLQIQGPSRVQRRTPTVLFRRQEPVIPEKKRGPLRAARDRHLHRQETARRAAAMTPSAKTGDQARNRWDYQKLPPREEIVRVNLRVFRGAAPIKGPGRVEPGTLPGADRRDPAPKVRLPERLAGKGRC